MGTGIVLKTVQPGTVHLVSLKTQVRSDYYYRVRSSCDIDWVFQRNIQFLQSYFRDDRSFFLMFVTPSLHTWYLAGPAFGPVTSIASALATATILRADRYRRNLCGSPDCLVDRTQKGTVFPDEQPTTFLPIRPNRLSPRYLGSAAGRAIERRFGAASESDLTVANRRLWHDPAS